MHICHITYRRGKDSCPVTHIRCARALTFPGLPRFPFANAIANISDVARGYNIVCYGTFRSTWLHATYRTRKIFVDCCISAADVRTRKDICSILTSHYVIILSNSSWIITSRQTNALLYEVTYIVKLLKEFYIFPIQNVFDISRTEYMYIHI